MIAGCRDDVRVDDAVTGGGSTSVEASSTGSEASSTGSDPSSEGTTSSSSSSSNDGSSSTGSETQPCEHIAVSLVLDRQAPIYGYSKREALARYFDDIVAQTGARVTVFPNAGAEQPPAWPCALDADGPGGGLGFVWGEDFVKREGAWAKLDCVLDGVHDYPHGSDEDGDWMFSGLMFPILEHDDWPPADTSLAIAMLLAGGDDDQSGMYPRPGMASEAFLRLAAGGERRRALAFTAGSDADEMHAFALSVSERSRYFDWNDGELPEALDTWLPEVVAACAEAEETPVPPPPGGCEHIDILFVVDGSLSMAQEQAALRGIAGPPVLAEFTDALDLELETLQDFHVGVISSEPGATTLHTHLDEPEVAPSPATDCGLPEGQRWLVGPSPTLAEDFVCIAGTNAQSTIESTTRNAALALHNPANAGFLRGDAVLFIVLLTDEDTLDYATSIDVRQQILDAVGGELDRVVILGIGIAGDQGVFEMPKTTCYGEYGTATPGRQISTIVFTFREQGLMQDICAGDLASVFDAALDHLVTTCNEYQPEG